jgi:D-alanyl-D-alanine carboxypeptidase
METASRSWKTYLTYALFVLLGASVLYGGYTLWDRTQTELADRNAQIEKYAQELDTLQQAYAVSEENGEELFDQLQDEKDRNDDFERQIRKLTGTVDDLDKLSKLDPELLEKYSKVYFLNEHYAPPRTKAIDSEFVFRKDEPEYIHAQVAPFLEDLLDAAKDDGVDLLVLSGYRSFDEQRSLKGAYTVQYGSGANAFSADQGYSEHQLGTTVDFTTASMGGTLVTSFETTPAYAWLQKYAYRYGFILSYPKDNAYYMYEPWHWRFVGTDLADDLHDDKENFYDMDQREIEKYLISIFD